MALNRNLLVKLAIYYALNLPKFDARSMRLLYRRNRYDSSCCKLHGTMEM